jgi:hypothetical protein
MSHEWNEWVIRSKSEWVRRNHDETSQNESCLDGRLIVLCVFFLLDECVEGKVYGFGVEDIEITEVAEKAEIIEVAEMAEMTKGVRVIHTTARHVVRPLAEMAEVSEMAKASIKTARHVM